MATNKKEPAKREVYISMDMNETTALREMGWRERWLYLELKWLANFKTGEVGTFGRQCITYEQLAGLVSVPASQGRAADTIDSKEAARLMMRLLAAGLIGEIGKRQNGGLRFALPLSPINKDAARKARQDKPSDVKLPESVAEQTAEEPDDDWDADDQPTSQSVMTCSKSINTFFNTGISSNDGAGEIPAPRRSGKNPKPIPLKTPTPGAIDIARIKSMLSNAGFVFVNTAESEKFYLIWIQQGFTELDLTLAIDEVKDNDSPTPMAVDTKLRRQRIQQSKPRNGWGRVAL